MLKHLKNLVLSRLGGRSVYQKIFYNPCKKQRSENVATSQKQDILLSHVSKKPLNEPLEGFEQLIYMDPSLSREQGPLSSRMTTLSNGLRVTSQPILGEYCTVGVVIDAGSRYEANYPPGLCHFIDKFAFSAQTETEQIGAMMECQSSRDVIFYASSCHKNVASKVIKNISDEVFRPFLTEAILERSANTIRHENDHLMKDPNCELLLEDYIYKAAFQNNSFGLSKYCKEENIDRVKIPHLLSFLHQYYTPDRIVLGGVGLDHEFLVDAAEKYFTQQKTVVSSNLSALLNPLPHLDNSVAQYTGGEVKVDRDLRNMALGPQSFPNLAHLVLGFEGAAEGDKDHVPFAVLQFLLRGGGSFSAGGPGKGMFSRLYIDVLHNYGWIHNATASNFSHADAGMFYIRASAPPKMMNVVPEIILNEYSKLTKGIDEVELNRAKVQLKSNMLMNLEIRPVMFENLVRQSLTYKEIRKAEYYAEKIDRVQSEDIVRIAEKMLNSKLSMAACGDLSYLPSYERVRSLI